MFDESRSSLPVGGIKTNNASCRGDENLLCLQNKFKFTITAAVWTASLYSIVLQLLATLMDIDAFNIAWYKQIVWFYFPGLRDVEMCACEQRSFYTSVKTGVCEVEKQLLMQHCGRRQKNSWKTKGGEKKPIHAGNPSFSNTHISGEPVLQLLSLMLKLPRLSLLVTLSSRGPLCSRRDTEVVAFCSSWDRCSMLL